MTHDELVTDVAKKTGQTKRLVKEVIGATVGSIVDCINKGDQILVPNLGRFQTKARKARTGSNPSTGVPVEIPAKNVPHMSFIGAVKDSVADLAVVQA